MANERFVPEKKLWGVLFSPSDAPFRIEYFTGIPFPNPPTLTEMNWINKVWIYAQSFRSYQLAEVLSRDPNEFIASYSLQFHNVFILGRELDRVAEIHEFAHGLNACLNLEASQIVDNENRDTDALLAGEAVSKKSFSEQASVLNVVDEGASLWLGMHAAQQTDPNATEALKYWNERVRTSSRGEIRSGNYSPDIRKTLQVFDHVVSKRTRAKVVEDPKARFDLVAETTDAMKKIQYPLGYWFVDASIRELKHQGLTEGQAYQKIVQNPPTRASQLHRPFHYARSLR